MGDVRTALAEATVGELIAELATRMRLSEAHTDDMIEIHNVLRYHGNRLPNVVLKSRLPLRTQEPAE